MNNRFTLFIIVAMILGGITGAAIHANVTSPEVIKEIVSYLRIGTDIFLRLIKMIIAPLVFSTLVVGIAHIGDTTTLGRVGLKTMGWFLAASAMSLLLGATIVTLLQPGAGVDISSTAAGVPTDIKPTALTLKDFVTHLVPKSIVEAMATNEILQIVVFSIFFGVALTAIGEKGKRVVDLAEEVSHVMLKVTGYVMLVAPVAVFCAISAIVAEKGLAVFQLYFGLVVGFYGGLAVLWTLLLFAGFVVLGPRVLRLISMMREPILLAFSTASSEAAYPKTMDQLERFGASKKIASFVLPLGYSFNLDGSMMYCTFATIFIAQAFGITLTLPQIATMLLMLMVTSKGMAGVPRASLVVIAATLPMFNIPEAGLLLLLGVDHFLDMGRSATNVVGNSIATAVVAKWEHQLGPEREAEAAGAAPEAVLPAAQLGTETG